MVPRGGVDERVKVVVPVCQSGSIEDVAIDRSADGHCDCAFWINYYRWCWPDIGSLIAPRALLIASGTEDILWRPVRFSVMWRTASAASTYCALDATGHFDLAEDVALHGYTPKLRKAIFTWFNRHLKGDPTPVEDDVTEFVEPEKNLLVFGGKLPADDLTRTIDTVLVQHGAQPEVTTGGGVAGAPAGRSNGCARQHSVTFRLTTRCADVTSAKMAARKTESFSSLMSSRHATDSTCA